MLLAICKRFTWQRGEHVMHLYGPAELAASIRTVRENTIKIAEDIPEERYGYRPTPERVARSKRSSCTSS